MNNERPVVPRELVIMAADGLGVEALSLVVVIDTLGGRVGWGFDAFLQCRLDEMSFLWRLSPPAAPAESPT